ncbi:MAG: AraC family ligand binding domain-containing protein [Gammaproteobacteria bacterium]|nr:AraC family ligand binding domain-containing protein [Gammaproteobacteria bacterium]
MTDTTVKKIDSAHAPRGTMGQTYLVSSVDLSMRLWDSEPTSTPPAPSSRAYETVGYVLNGRARLECEGQTLLLEPGNAWVVPVGAMHEYHILEPFTALEVTHPPAHLHDRDR